MYNIIALKIQPTKRLITSPFRSLSNSNQPPQLSWCLSPFNLTDISNSKHTSAIITLVYTTSNQFQIYSFPEINHRREMILTLN